MKERDGRGVSLIPPQLRIIGKVNRRVALLFYYLALLGIDRRHVTCRLEFHFVIVQKKCVTASLLVSKVTGLQTPRAQPMITLVGIWASDAPSQCVLTAERQGDSRLKVRGLAGNSSLISSESVDKDERENVP